MSGNLMKSIIIMLVLGIILPFMFIGCNMRDAYTTHCGSYAKVINLETKEVIAIYDDVNYYTIISDPIIILKDKAGQNTEIKAKIATGHSVLTVEIIQGHAPDER